MIEKLLNLVNLNDRVYVHGTSIMRGLLAELNRDFQQAEEFEIRLKKKLMFLPILTVQDSENAPSEATAIGKFKENGIQYYFYLTPSDIPCTQKLIVDEKYIRDRMYETDTEWCVNLEEDDILICINEITKASNMELFTKEPHIVVAPGKQTWLAGFKLPSIAFFNKPCKVIGISKEYQMLAPTCMRRYVTIDGVRVGERIGIYA